MLTALCLILVGALSFCTTSSRDDGGTGDDDQPGDEGPGDDTPDDGAFIVFADRDNTLFDSPMGSLSNGQGSFLFVGKTAGTSGPLNVRRGIVYFDVATAIGGPAQITRAILRMNMSREADGTDRDIDLHRLEADWGEGTSEASRGEGDTSATNDATWVHRFFNSSSWTTDGGDFNPVASATATVTGAGDVEWESVDLTADVQDFLDNPSNNFGWILIGDESSNGSVKRFSSREGGSPPELEIEFNPL